MLLRNEAMGGDLVPVEKALCVTPVFKTNARGNERDNPDGARARGGPKIQKQAHTLLVVIPTHAGVSARAHTNTYTRKDAHIQT